LEKGAGSPVRRTGAYRHKKALNIYIHVALLESEPLSTRVSVVTDK